MNIVDSSALIDYFLATERGEKLRPLLEKEAPAICAITLAEMAKWSYQNDKDADHVLSLVLSACKPVLYTTRSMEKRAGELCVKINAGRSRHEQKVSLIDCIVAATAEYYDLTMLATDPDFEEFPQKKLVIK